MSRQLNSAIRACFFPFLLGIYINAPPSKTLSQSSLFALPHINSFYIGTRLIPRFNYKLIKTFDLHPPFFKTEKFFCKASATYGQEQGVWSLPGRAKADTVAAGKCASQQVETIIRSMLAIIGTT
jgi:hypothetical protein